MIASRILSVISLLTLCTFLLGCPKSSLEGLNSGSLSDSIREFEGIQTEIDPITATNCEPESPCSDGQICLDNRCFWPCFNLADCPEDEPVCNEETGVCVPCEYDEQCIETGFCEVETGRCTTSNMCDNNEDCPPGFACDEGRCFEPPHEADCLPGEQFCEEDSIATCEDSGQAFQLEWCGAGQTCMESLNGVTCEDIICTPERLYCVGDDIAQCDETGTQETLIECGANYTCINHDGVPQCTVQICTANTEWCDGGQVVTCDSTGTESILTSCSAGTSCHEGEDGTVCLPLLCEPSSTGCLDSSTAYDCSDDGIQYEARDCSSDEICISGVCYPTECIPEEKSCLGNVLVNCNEFGEVITETDCVLTDSYCNETGDLAACIPWICDPSSEFYCNEDGLYSCTDSGSSTALIEVCESGRCEDSACVPCQPEQCDGLDNDCNGEIDNGLEQVLLRFESDHDLDGLPEVIANNFYNDANQLVQQTVDSNSDGEINYVFFFTFEGLLQTAIDLDQDADGIIDWRYSESVFDDLGNLIAKENDVDGDGTADDIRWYAYEAALMTQKIHDYNADGDIDTIKDYFYLDGILDYEYVDIDADGIPDHAFLFYHDPDGNLLEAYVDDDLDGSSDWVWVQQSYNEDGLLISGEYDRDGDGIIDEVMTYEYDCNPDSSDD